jgi:hypothetical protein
MKAFGIQGDVSLKRVLSKGSSYEGDLSED